MDVGGRPPSASISPLCRSLVTTGSGRDQGDIWGVSVEACGSRAWNTGVFPAKGQREGACVSFFGGKRGWN